MVQTDEMAEMESLAKMALWVAKALKVLLVKME
jgi:hypothetical protein